MSYINDYPCYGCLERQLGCHSTCEKYIGKKQTNDALLEEKRKQDTIYHAYVESGYRHSRKTKEL